MSDIKTIKVDPGLLQMPVIARGGGAIYMRLPQDLQRECGGCSCDYCKAHPEIKPAWDTLVVSGERQTRIDRDWSWTVHMPDPTSFTAALKRTGK
jgi:hypothetical protein